MTEINWRAVPVIGQDIYQVGQVLDITQQACVPDAYITARAFFQYIPMLAWSLFKPTPFDTFTEIMGRRHRRKRRMRFARGILDVGPEFSKPGIYSATWKVSKAFERLGWYFLVIDATSDFLINWTSMAYKFSGCSVPGAPYGQIIGTLPRQQFSVGSWTQMIFPDVLQSNIWGVNLGTISANTFGPKAATLSVNWETPTRGPRAEILETRIEKSGSTPHTWTVPAPDQDFPGQPVQTTLAPKIYSELEAPGTYTASFRAGTGFVRMGTRVLMASGTLDDGIEHDP